MGACLTFRRRVSAMGEDAPALPVVVGSLRVYHVEGVPPVMCCACAWVLESGAWLRVERDAAGDDSWDNLQALCHACHSRKTVSVDKALQGGIKSLEGARA